MNKESILKSLFYNRFVLYRLWQKKTVLTTKKEALMTDFVASFCRNDMPLFVEFQASRDHVWARAMEIAAQKARRSSTPNIVFSGLFEKAGEKLLSLDSNRIFLGVNVLLRKIEQLKREKEKFRRVRTKAKPRRVISVPG